MPSRLTLHRTVQVSLATQTPGIVLITVTGYNVPKGPQNYSLAVQGDFKGVLASPRNPSWNRTSAGNCSLPLPQITAGPLGLINATSAIFNFTSSYGEQGPSIFRGKKATSPKFVSMGLCFACRQSSGSLSSCARHISSTKIYVAVEIKYQRCRLAKAMLRLPEAAAEASSHKKPFQGFKTVLSSAHSSSSMLLSIT